MVEKKITKNFNAKDVPRPEPSFEKMEAGLWRRKSRGLIQPRGVVGALLGGSSHDL